MVTYAAAPQPMTVMEPQTITYAASPVSMAPTYTAMSQHTMLPMQTTAQLPTVLKMPAKAQTPTVEAQPSTALPIPLHPSQLGPQRLAVSILEAYGLQGMNPFVDDHP